MLNSSENDNKTNDVKNIEIIFLLSGIIEVLLGFILPSEVLKQQGHGGEQNGKPEQELKDLEILLVLNAQLKSGLFTNALRYLISV